MPQKIDLTGKRFGKLVVLSEVAERKNKSILWECRCDCGNKVIVQGMALRCGHTKSCGCLKIEKFTEMAKMHPRKTISKESKTRLYRIWKDMRRRTVNPKRQNYHRYGGRGIKVCNEWFENYQAFKEWAYLNGYKDTLSIDRIDNDGDYCPDNCRWVDKTEQARNRTNTMYYTHNGVTKTVAEWSEITGIPYTTIVRRIKSGNDLDALREKRWAHA